MPESVDEFYRLVFARFRKRRGWLEWFNQNPSLWFPKQRFVSFSEFQEAFVKRSGNFGDLLTKYPVYRLANLKNHTQQDDFMRSYESKNLEGYFVLMHKKNPKMFTLYTEEQKIYIPKKERGTHTYIIGKSGC